MVPVANKEPAAEWFQRELDSSLEANGEIGRRQIGSGELADVRDERGAGRAVHAVYADAGRFARQWGNEVRADDGDQRVCGSLDESDVDHTAGTEGREGKTTGKRRESPILRVDPRDSADRGFGDVE